MKTADKRLQKTPVGGYIPPSRDIPTGGVAYDPWRSLAPFMESPMTRLGQRRGGRWIGVGTMMEMQTDELIQFLLAYQAALLANADTKIRCADPTIQKFFEAMYTAIHRDLMLSCAPALFYGYQALVKQFSFGIPPNDGDESIWQGTAQPLILKGVKQLAADAVIPASDDNGRFAGIETVLGGAPVPVVYSLWLTIGKHWVAGDYYGMGRAVTTYEAWWQKHFTIDQRTLWIQRGVDPVVVMRHPSGVYTEPGKDTPTANSEVAQRTGDNARAGTTITMPSDLHVVAADGGYEQRPTSARQWDIDYLINTANPGPLTDIKDDEDRRIAFGMYFPPQAVLEAKSLGLGGPNTAEVLGTVAEQTLLQDIATIDAHLNEYVFPFILAANFGPNAARVYKETLGLNEAARAAVQATFEALLSRADTNATIFDLRGMAERLHVPLIEQTVDPAPALAPAVQAERAASGLSAKKRAAVVSSINPDDSAPENAGEQDSEETDESIFGPDEEISDNEVDAAREAVRALLDEAGRKVMNKMNLAVMVQSFVFPSIQTHPLRFNPVTRVYREALERLRARVQSELETKLQSFENGNAPSDTIRRMTAILRAGALQAAQLGVSERDGTDAALSKQDRAAVEAWIKGQQVYLRKVYTLMRKTLDSYPGKENDAARQQAVSDLVTKLVNARIPLYVNAMAGQFERSRARFTISMWPGSGDTDCITNCKCSLDWGEDEQGPFVIWKLGAAEHCRDCPDLAARSPFREGEL